MSEPSDKGKIYVDSDWKTEAAEEKRRLDEQTKQAAGQQAFPHAGFLEIVNLLAMQATVSISGMRTPTGETIPPDIHAAKHFIDMLAVLQEKTDGNLGDEEKKALDAVLYELQMRYADSVRAGVPKSVPKGPPSQA